MSARRRAPLSRRGRLVSAAFGVVVAAGWLVLGSYGVAHGLHENAQLKPVKDGVMTTGRVVDVKPSCDRGCTWAAVVTFVDQSGTTHELVAPNSDEKPNIGSTVPVSYDPRHPADAHDLGDTSTWGVEIATMIFILVLWGFFVSASAWAWVRRRLQLTDSRLFGRILVGQAQLSRISMPTYTPPLPGAPKPVRPKPTRDPADVSTLGLPKATVQGAVTKAESIMVIVVDAAICVTAFSIGVTHHAVWIAVPAWFGLFLPSVMLGGVSRRISEAAVYDTPVRSWWRRRGRWLLLVSGIPGYVALGFAIASI